jgi:predicted Zn finger-like uncharacterized protein
MVISCPNCATRLQLDDAKVPARPFTVRCPKCQHIINAQPAAASASDGSAIAVGGDLPSTTRAQRDAKSINPPGLNVSPETSAEGAMLAAPMPEGADVARMLAALLGQGVADAGQTSGTRRRPVWDKRRALVCVSVSYRQEIAQDLSRERYEVYVADTTAQAIERLREEKIEVIVLDPEFDLTEQGAAFVTREINALRPAERRRLVVVHLAPEARTEDAHAAFLSNVNLVVNAGAVRELPRALEHTVRDLNELYKNYNKALGVGEL